MRRWIKRALSAVLFLGLVALLIFAFLPKPVEPRKLTLITA